MPYVPSEKTVPPAQDRAELDPVVETVAQRLILTHDGSHALSEALCKAFLDADRGILRVLNNSAFPDESTALGSKVMEIAKRYEYDGAHLGLLNYSLTRLIQRVPQLRVETGKWKDEMRYWVHAVTCNALFKAAALSTNSKTCNAGVFIDVMLEYKRRVNVAYEAAQIIKSGDCYDTPYYTRLIPLQGVTGELIGHLEVMLKRSAATLTVDELSMYLVAHVAEASPS